MRHRVSGRRLGRTKAHRLALMRNLSTSLLEKERITTTLAKAKELRGFTERLVTLSKKETLHARRQVLRHIHNPAVVGKLFDTLSARFAQRPGGYTRVIKLGPRRGDHAEMAVIELVEAAGTAAAADDDAEAGAKEAKTSKAAKADKASGAKAGKKAAAPAAGTKKKAPAKKAAPRSTSTKKASTKKAGGNIKKSASTVRKSS